MKTLYRILLYGMLGYSLFLYYNRVYKSSCDTVIEYDIGNFDEGFNVTRDQFLTTIEQAELPWEEISGNNIFRYTPGAKFKVNLIFSEQQQKINEGDKLLEKINRSEGTIDNIDQRYDNALKKYNKASVDYNYALSLYEKNVNYWNTKGGAPEAEYKKIQNQQKKLDSQFNTLQGLQKQVNRIVDEKNGSIEKHNTTVNYYNNLFDEGHEFDAGDTDQTEINIYSYNSRAELHTILVHEFGHVLGIDHLEDPYAVMHYLLSKKNITGDINENDRIALRDVCRIKEK